MERRIRDFVDQYNSTVDFIRGKVEEKRVARPEKQSDREKGLLSGDLGLTSLLAKLRQAVTGTVGGNAFTTLAEVGLTTGKPASSGLERGAVNGWLELDGAALTAKLEASFADVKALFSSPTGSAASEGLAERLERILRPWLRGDGLSGAIMGGRIASVDDSLRQLKTREKELELRLATREKALRATFAGMESALAGELAVRPARAAEPRARGVAALNRRRPRSTTGSFR